MAITKKDVERSFYQFAKLYNLHTSAERTNKEVGEVGDFYTNDFLKLDCNFTYGGFVLMVVNKSTSQRAFDSHNRLSTKEMYYYLQGLIAAKKNYPFEAIVK